MKCSLGIFNFLEEISSLSHSVVFLYFFMLITEAGFFFSLLAILWNSALKWVGLSFSLLLFSELFVRSPQTAVFTLNLLNQPSQMGPPNLIFSFLRTIGLENMQLYLVRGKR